MKLLGERTRRLAWRYLARQPGRSLAKPLFHAAVRAELLAARLLDGPPEKDPLDDATAVIKTFERPNSCARLIASIRRRCPQLRLVVVDDSRRPVTRHGVTNVHLPFDSGVGAGRAAGLAEVTTPFVVNLDDDLIFYSGTRLGEAIRLLRAERRLNLVGGSMVDLPLWIDHDHAGDALHAYEVDPVIAPGTRIGPAVVQDKTSNFFVARTDAVRQVGWDPTLRRLDHADFFTRARGRIVAAMSERLRILHYRDPFDDHYRALRFDLRADQELLSARYRHGRQGREEA